LPPFSLGSFSAGRRLRLDIAHECLGNAFAAAAAVVLPAPDGPTITANKDNGISGNHEATCARASGADTMPVRTIACTSAAPAETPRQ